MPKTYKRRRAYRSHKAQSSITLGPWQYQLSPVHLMLFLAIATLLIAFLINILFNPTSKNTIPRDTQYSVVGKPTISANFINSVLLQYRSPARDKGQALYDDGVKYNIDPAYALAFFMQESNLGNRGVATVTHSLGNIRATAGHPSYNGYRSYSTWEEGFEDWYRLISQEYIQNRGLTTVSQIIPVYAPATDNNDDQNYIQTVEYFVDHWRDGVVAA
jgi:Mannosyl-glycoprotein endo-beta-N-acetylglucosaminidase